MEWLGLACYLLGVLVMRAVFGIVARDSNRAMDWFLAALWPGIIAALLLWSLASRLRRRL